MIHAAGVEAPQDPQKFICPSMRRVQQRATSVAATSSSAARTPTLSIAASSATAASWASAGYEHGAPSAHRTIEERQARVAEPARQLREPTKQLLASNAPFSAEIKRRQVDQQKKSSSGKRKHHEQRKEKVATPNQKSRTEAPKKVNLLDYIDKYQAMFEEECTLEQQLLDRDITFGA